MTQVRGYCRNKEQAAWLKSHGLSEKAIYLQGRGAEDLDECLASFRGRVGKLVIATDLRAFGETKKTVAATMTRLEKARIRVVDISHPADITISELLQRANQHISGYRFRDRRTARRRGREGGIRRGIAARHARASIPTDSLIRNIVAETDIPWSTKSRITGISMATLRRHYLPKRTRRKVKKKTRKRAKSR